MDGGRFSFVPAVFLVAGLIWSVTVAAQTAGAPLVLETKIPLGAKLAAASITWASM